MDLFDLEDILDPITDDQEKKNLEEDSEKKSETVKSVNEEEGVQDISKENKGDLLSQKDIEKMYGLDDDEEEDKKNKEKDKEKDGEKDEEKFTAPEEKNKKPENEDTGSNERINTFTKGLIESGVLDEVEEDKLKEVKDFDSLKTLIQDTISKREFSDLSDTQKEYLEAIRDGVNHDIVIQHQNITGTLNNIKEEDLKQDEALSQKLYVTFLKQKGFDEDRIKKMVKKSIDTDTLVEDAKDSLEDLKKVQADNFNAQRQKEKEEKDNLKKVQQENDKKLKELLYQGKAEFIKGSKVSPKEGKEIYESINTAVHKTEDGVALNEVQKFALDNPIEYKARLHYLFKKGFFSTEADLSGIEKRTKSEVIKKFNSMFDENNSLRGGKPAHQQKDLNEESYLDELIDSI